MRLNEVNYDNSQPIEGYGPGFFRIGGQVHDGPLLTSAEGNVPWTGLEDHGPLLALAGKVDVIFFGTGKEIAHLPKGLRSTLEELQIGCEVMSSATAARTYNVILSEGRRIALAALPV